MDRNRTISVSLPESLISIIEKTKEKRQDPTRSDTVRILILRALAEMALLPEETKAALGIRRN